MSIYVYKNEQQEGPYEVSAIHEGLSTGYFVPEDLAFTEGLTDWAPLHTLLEAPKTEAFGRRLEKKVEQLDEALSGFLGEDQDPAVVDKIVKKAKELLTKGEQIEYVGIQKKPVLTISPDAILLTNKRFMIVRQKMLGMNFDDHVWREVKDVHMSEQMLSATITCQTTSGINLSIDSIPKKQARRIYSYAQEIEERMHEERRNRAMEEKRAAAGGVIVQAPAHSPMPSGQAGSEDPMIVLSKLKKLLDAGLIESSEFEAKKQEVLARL